MEKIQVLGLCRFSYPSAPGGFDDQTRSMEDVRARLYEPRRMALRFLWFEHVALPSLRQQTDRNFTVVVLAGDRMPAEHRQRLLDLLVDTPQIKPLFLEEGQVHRDACRAAMQAHRDPAAHAVAEFRLDDDDAVADIFVERTRMVFRHVRHLFEMRPRVSVDFCRGALLRVTEEGIDLRPVVAQHWTPGLVNYRKPDDPLSLLDALHTKLWKGMPLLTLPFPPMYVRGAHEDNASAISRRWDKIDSWQTEPHELRRLLGSAFGIDLPAMETAIKAWRKGR
ncbi:glycosyltransferase [Roseisalinus antarcticus]|uniref:Rhamnosyl transferase n=1 Tax=Roseisalinus antarcticus TaxID=254357 RepID=A0A1Y5TZ77_9RHOB|nr:glycosyltransferase [Roseisalinus antarcticus]SLN77409.1 hypothetical protein ROA7023_04393 [Roseisalinus antarcticus]